jgi:hypothetical protein
LNIWIVLVVAFACGLAVPRWPLILVVVAGWLVVGSSSGVPIEGNLAIWVGFVTSAFVASGAASGIGVRRLIRRRHSVAS